jgi:hypothetical protein
VYKRGPKLCSSVPKVQIIVIFVVCDQTIHCKLRVGELNLLAVSFNLSKGALLWLLPLFLNFLVDDSDIGWCTVEVGRLVP